MSKLDLAIAYRVYPKVSKPTPIFANDKLKLAELCLRSFRKALAGLHVKVYALLDNCPPAYEALFHECFMPGELELTPLAGIGNRPTFGRQIDLLLGQNEAELVYFAEDDYYYRPNGIVEMVEFIRGHGDVDFLTPYEHPDSYKLPLHPRRQELRPFGRHHWRTCASTCLTFLTRRKTLNRTARIFRTYQSSNLDVSIWMSLTKQTARNPLAFIRCCATKLNYGGYIGQAWRYTPWQLAFGPKWKLWCPIPAVATHMESAFLAPLVDWRRLFAGDAP